MPHDGTPLNLPPGVLEGYLAAMQSRLELFGRLARRLDRSGGDREALERLRREVHKVHGSAGSYGFWEASRLAAGMEETAKDWVSRPDGVDVDRGALTRWFVGRLAGLMKLDAPAGLPTPPSGGPGPRGVPEVVVVEDDAALAELLEYGLSARGYRFARYRDGGRALADLLALDTGGTHPLLLLDVTSPGLAGYAISEALRRERPGVYRMVFTTVRGKEREGRRGLEAGALDYIVKPVCLRVLLEKIESWLAG